MRKSIRSVTHPRRLLALTSGVALALLTAACTTTNDPPTTGTITLDGYRSRHPIVVDQGQETFDVPVGDQSGRLTPHLMASIEGFARTAREEGATGVTMMVPSGSANESAAYRASREVVAALGRAGIARSAVSVVAYSAEGPEDAAPIRLSYPRIVARVPHRCGMWPDQIVGSMDNSDYWNFGCATQSNIAAMVSEPSDLVSPAPIGKADATRRAAVLQSYRKGEKTKSDFKLPDTSASQVGSGGGQ